MKPGRLLMAFLLFSPVTLFCQEEKISAEQPDQSYGAETLKKSELQLESSLYYNDIKDNPLSLISSNLLRYGISKKWEVRLLVEQGDDRDVYITKTAHSTYPLALGTKVNLVEEKGNTPGVSFVAYVQLPFTNGSEQSKQWSPGLIGIIEKQFSKFNITLNSGIKEEAFEHKWEFLNTGDIKYEATDKLQVFVEYFGQYEAHESPVHNMDTGLLFFLSNNLQIHVAGGMSIAHDPSYYFVNTGFAVKLHNKRKG